MGLAAVRNGLLGLLLAATASLVAVIALTPSATDGPVDAARIRAAYNGLVLFADDALARPSPRCELTDDHKDRYRSLVNSTAAPTLLVLRVNTDVSSLFSTVEQIATLAAFLGPERLRVSITQTGAGDDDPVDMIAALSAMLDALDIPQAVVLRPWSVDAPPDLGLGRSEAVAAQRNAAVDIGANSFGDLADVLFIDPAIFCAADLLETLFVRRQGAHMTCAPDFTDGAPMRPRPVFKSTWETRLLAPGPNADLTFDLTNATDPVLNPLALGDDDARRWAELQPIQVFSCFGPIVAIDNDIFQAGVRFLSVPDDRASGDSMFAQTLWRVTGAARISIASRARVAGAPLRCHLAEARRRSRHLCGGADGPSDRRCAHGRSHRLGYRAAISPHLHRLRRGRAGAAAVVVAADGRKSSRRASGLVPAPNRVWHT